MSTPSGYPAASEPFGIPASTPPAGSAYPATAGPFTGQQPAPGRYPHPSYGAPAQSYPAGPGYPAGQVYPTPGAGPAFPTGPAFQAMGAGQRVGAGRPSLVTAASVLAFVWGGLGILFGLIALAAGSLLSSASTAVCSSGAIGYDSSGTGAATCDTVSGATTFLFVVTAATMVVAALMIWGGVVALSGKNGQILVIACACYAVLALASVIASGFGFSFLLGIVIPILVVVFMLNPQSRAWIRSVGGKTF